MEAALRQQRKERNSISNIDKCEDKEILVIYYNNEAGTSLVPAFWCEKTKASNTSAESVRYGKYPILGVIRYSKKVAENSFLRKPIYEYSPCCSAAQDYKKFVTAYTGEGR